MLMEIIFIGFCSVVTKFSHFIDVDKRNKKRD